MNDTAVTSLITGTANTWSTDAYTVLAVIIGIGVAFLIFRWGWKRIKSSTDAGVSSRATRASNHQMESRISHFGE